MHAHAHVQSRLEGSMGQIHEPGYLGQKHMLGGSWVSISRVLRTLLNKGYSHSYPTSVGLYVQP